MRYVAANFIEGTFRRGKSLEQFLGGYVANGECRFRRVELRPTKAGQIEVWLFDDPDLGFPDIYEFGSDHEAPDHPLGTFETPADALKFAHAHLSASFDRWVNEGVAASEYEDFVAAGRPERWPPG
jgi:hypothetical protein